MAEIYRCWIVLFNTLLLLIGSCYSCWSADGKVQINETHDKRDFQLFTIVCRDILSDEQLKTLLKEVAADKSTPQVCDETQFVESPSFYFLPKDLKKMKLASIPKSLIDELKVQNPHTTRITRFTPPKPFTMVSRAFIASMYEENNGNTKPLFRMYFARPAYSRNSKQAVVMFSFADGRTHPNFGIYHLIRAKGRWRIKVKQIQFMF